VAPICVWLATEAAAGITSQIFHTGRGGIAIMQQPAVIKQFHKASGVWTLGELDRYVPKLVAAKQAHDRAVKEAATPIDID
jgi:hypothetical protein